MQPALHFINRQYEHSWNVLWLNIFLSVHPSIHPSIQPPTSPPTWWPIQPSIYLLTYLPTYLINSLNKGIPRGATFSSSSQEIPHTLRNLKVHHHVHNSLLLIHILSQINPLTLHHPIPLRAISILSSHLSLRLPSSHFSLILGDIVSLCFYPCLFFNYFYSKNKHTFL